MPERPRDREHDHAHSQLSETELRMRALESVFDQEGYVDPAALDLLIETYEKKTGPHNGPAWSPGHGPMRRYKRGLLADATPAIASLGIAGFQSEHAIAVESMPTGFNFSGLHSSIAQ